MTSDGKHTFLDLLVLRISGALFVSLSESTMKSKSVSEFNTEPLFLRFRLRVFLDTFPNFDDFLLVDRYISVIRLNTIK